MNRIRSMRGPRLAPAALFLLLAACSVLLYKDREEGSMARAATDLRRLSNAMQGELWRGAPPGSDLAALACRRDPSLCDALAEFDLQVKQEGDEAVLLLCTKDKGKALLENVACTPEIDFKAWEQGKLPCRFTLSADLCK